MQPLQPRAQAKDPRNLHTVSNLFYNLYHQDWPFALTFTGRSQQAEFLRKQWLWEWAAHPITTQSIWISTKRRRPSTTGPKRKQCAFSRSKEHQQVRLKSLLKLTHQMSLWTRLASLALDTAMQKRKAKASSKTTIRKKLLCLHQARTMLTKRTKSSPLEPEEATSDSLNAIEHSRSPNH